MQNLGDHTLIRKQRKEGMTYSPCRELSPSNTDPLRVGSDVRRMYLEYVHSMIIDKICCNGSYSCSSAVKLLNAPSSIATNGLPSSVLRME